MSLLTTVSPSRRLIDSLLLIPGVNLVSLRGGLELSTSHLDISFIPKLPNGKEATVLISINITLPFIESESTDYLAATRTTLNQIADSLSSSLNVQPAVLDSISKGFDEFGPTTSESLEKIQTQENSQRQAVILPFRPKIKKDWKPFDGSAA